MHLVEQLRLVLSNGSLDLGAHQELIVVVEDLEHLVGGDSLGKLLLQQLCQLRLNLRCALVICFLGRVPGLLALFGNVKHIVDAFDKCRQGVPDIVQGLSTELCSPLTSIAALLERSADHGFELVVLAAEDNDRIEAAENGIFCHVLEAIFNLSAFLEPSAVGPCAAHTGLQLSDRVPPLRLQLIYLLLELLVLSVWNLHDWSL